jgi:PAS domain S-box-containing protein
MFWLFLLGLATILTIALRRTRRKLKPLDDELYSKTVAIDYVQSGVAWVRADGTFGSLNQAFAKILGAAPADLVGRDWYKMFPPERYDQMKEIYSQVLLQGALTFDAPGISVDGSLLWLNVRLVAVHDHHMRFVGHHCLVEDRTRVCDLEERLRALSVSAERLNVSAEKRELRAQTQPTLARR